MDVYVDQEEKALNYCVCGFHVCHEAESLGTVLSNHVVAVVQNVLIAGHLLKKQAGE